MNLYCITKSCGLPHFLVIQQTSNFIIVSPLLLTQQGRIELNHTLRCYLFGILNYIVYLCAINPEYYDYSQERAGSGGISP